MSYFLAVASSMSAFCVSAAPADFSRIHSGSDTARPGLCDDARSLLKAALIDRAGPNDVLSSEPPDYLVQPAKPVNGIRRMTPFGPDSGYWRIGWERQPPSPELVRRWYALPYGSISKCFRPLASEQPLAALLGVKSTIFKPLDGPAASALHVSYPAFDRSRTHALLQVSRYFFHGSGGGRLELVLLTRTKSGWRKSGTRYLGSV
jgi:hypothetical protein